MLTAVIPVFNKAHLTKRCLESMLDHSKIVDSVVVIDNASSDETPELLSSFASRFEQKGISFAVIRNAQNVGFGRACNQGVRLAKGKYVAIVNNDTWLMPAWDEALAQVLEEKNLDAVGPHFDERPFSEDPVTTAKEFLRKSPNQFRKHFVPILMFFRMSSVEKLKFEHGGIFDERYFVTYEDTDLKKRMEDLGMKWGQTSRSYLWHQSMGTRGTPGLIPTGYEAEGLRLFMEKWGYDPRPAEHTWIERLKRKFRKKRSAKGLF